MLFVNNARWVAGVFFLALLSACGTPLQTKALTASAPAGLPERIELARVAFYPQQEHQCGPAALAMALSGTLDIRPEQLNTSLYLPAAQGSLQVEMLAAARRQGGLAYRLSPLLSDVLAEVAAGNPVVVLQNLGLSWYPVWHYAVVIGYDLPQRDVILRSGNERRLLLPLSTFERTWARAQYWAMVVLVPGQLPGTAEPNSYLQALLALQHSSPQTDASPGYDAALDRWPTHLAVQISAGNYAYTRRELDRAESIYLAATHRHPDSAVAYNNLAQVQGERGKLGAALASARRAVELGGPLQTATRETLAEIERKIQMRQAP